MVKQTKKPRGETNWVRGTFIDRVVKESLPMALTLGAELKTGH